jgi:hypothetical protein
VQGIIDFISQPGFEAHDQWQVQVQAQILQRAEVHVYSDGLSDEQIDQALFIPCRNIEMTVAGLLDKYGSQARMCVMPEGPQVIPYLLQFEG